MCIRDRDHGAAVVADELFAQNKGLCQIAGAQSVCLEGCVVVHLEMCISDRPMLYRPLPRLSFWKCQNDHYLMLDEDLTRPIEIEFCTGSFSGVRTSTFKAVDVYKRQVVAQDHGAAVVADELFAQNKGLCQTIGRGLDLILQMDAVLAAIAQQRLKARRISGGGDDQDILNARQHEGGQRIVCLLYTSTTSQSRIRSTAPLVGEPLADRRVFVV